MVKKSETDGKGEGGPISQAEKDHITVEEKCAKDETDTHEKKAKKAIPSKAPAPKGDIDEQQDGIGSDNHEDT